MQPTVYFCPHAAHNYTHVHLHMDINIVFEIMHYHYNYPLRVVSYVYVCVPLLDALAKLHLVSIDSPTRPYTIVNRTIDLAMLYS